MGGGFWYFSPAHSEFMTKKQTKKRVYPKGVDASKVPRSQRLNRVKHIGARPITAKQLEFVQAYCRLHNSVKKACEEVGVNPGTAYDWVRHPVVVAEIDKIKEELRKKTGYDLEYAMAEAEDAKQFAKQTNNANAVVKAVELKTKLNGLLIEKHDHRLAANFMIQIEGVKHTALPSGASPPAVTSSPVPALPNPNINEEEELLS